MSIFGRLYRGETNIDFIGPRKRWYAVSAIILLLCIGSMVFRGFNFGVEFAGGNQFRVPVKADTSLEQVRGAAESVGVEVSSAQTAGQGDQRNYVIRTPELTDQQRTAVTKAITDAAKINEDEVTANEVSSSWGSAVTRQALIGLVVFLVLVGIYIWIRFEQKMAIAAIAALFHDLIFAAGIYSMVGFEVTPGTIVGLLTILGFSLYDTVVVFDKVDENTRGLLGQSRYTYGEAANLAVNQTLMRSINTSLIGLLPVGGLLFVGVGLLGVGTLKDLALVLFVGMLTGAYSSLFLATPWLVDLKYLDPRYSNHAQRVEARRQAQAKGEEPAAGRRAKTETAEGAAEGEEAPVEALAGSSAPRVGTKPTQRKRPGGAGHGRPGGGSRSGKRR